MKHFRVKILDQHFMDYINPLNPELNPI